MRLVLISKSPLERLRLRIVDVKIDEIHLLTPLLL